MELKGYALDWLLMTITLDPDTDGAMHPSCDTCKASADVSIVRGKPQEPLIETKEHRLRERLRSVSELVAASKNRDVDRSTPFGTEDQA